MEPTELIWMNGDFVAWEDAKVHVLTHGLHYGTGVFEGIRCYETERGPAIFRNARSPRAAAALGRALLHASAVQPQELRAATLELVARNGLSSCYIRPIINRGYGQMGLNPSRRRSTSRSPAGSGGPIWVRRPSATASARRSPPGGGSAPTR